MDTVDGSVIFRNYHMPQDNMAPNQSDDDIEIISAMPIGRHMGNASLGYMNLKQVPCHICNKMFSSKGSKYLHIRYVHLNIRNYACQFCDLRCHKKSDLTRHHAIHYRKNHTPRNGFKTENDNSFKTKVHTDINKAQESQAAYMNNMQSNINEESQYSRMESSNSLGSKVRIDFDTAQKIQASFVSSVQSSMDEMSKYSINSSHYKLKSQTENIFTFDQARKTYSINTDGLSLAAQRLLLYVLTENLTCCPVCNKHYSTKHSLKSHIRFVHNNVRNHACEICGKRFFKKGDVDRHVLVHEKKPLGSSIGMGLPSPDHNHFTNWDTSDIEIIQEKEVMMQERGEVMMQEDKLDSVVEMNNGVVFLYDVQIDNNADQSNRFMKGISTVKIPQAIDNSQMISPEPSEKIYYEKNHEIIILDNEEQPQVLKITSLNNTPELNKFEDQNQKIKDIWSPLRRCQQNDTDYDHNVNRKPSIISISGPQNQNFNKCQKCGALFTYKGLLETHSCSLTSKDTYEGSIILECEEGPVFDRSDYEADLVFNQQIMVECE